MLKASVVHALAYMWCVVNGDFPFHLPFPPHCPWSMFPSPYPRSFWSGWLFAVCLPVARTVMSMLFGAFYASVTTVWLQSPCGSVLHGMLSPWPSRRLLKCPNPFQIQALCHARWCLSQHALSVRTSSCVPFFSRGGRPPSPLVPLNRPHPAHPSHIGLES